MARWSEETSPSGAADVSEAPGFLVYLALSLLIGVAIIVAMLRAGYVDAPFFGSTLFGGLAWLGFKVGKGYARRALTNRPQPAFWRPGRFPALALLFVISWLVAALYFGIGMAAAKLSSLL